MIKRILTFIFGSIIGILFWPFKGLVEKRQKRIKNQYIENPTSIPDYETHAILNDLAWNEYHNGNLDIAKKYSEELLRLNKIVERNWNYGNAIHHPNTILGLICLDEGKIECAKNHLIKSSKTTGSPQLDTFGPCFDLAQRLIEVGEKKVIIKYLKNCQTFWEHDKGRILKWLSEIENGEIPQMKCEKKT